MDYASAQGECVDHPCQISRPRPHMPFSTSSTSPISTCLVGIPFTPEEFPKSILFHQAQANSMKAAFKLVQAGEFFRQVKLHVVNPLLLWSEWVDTFLELDREAQGLELMGSVAAAQCIHFDYPVLLEYQKEYHVVRQFDECFMAKNWCRQMAKITRPSTESLKPQKPGNGTFLICGDRAWGGIPSRLIGGPRTIGRLGLFTPNKTQVINWARKSSVRFSRSKKRPSGSRS